MVGARWFYRGFESNHDGSAYSVERFHSAELWARFYPVKRLQLMGILPLNYFNQREGSSVMTRQGMGDVVVLAHYNLLQQAWGQDKKWRQALYLGGGIKLPTGKFERPMLEYVNPNMQPGTGSTDWLLSATYTLRYGDWGISTDALLRINRENREGYRFGNRINAGGRFFYWAKTGRSNWLPSLGIAHEWAAPDSDRGLQTSDTGGYCLLGTAGLDWYLGHLALGANWHLPIHQYLGAGHISAGQRVQVSMTYMF